MITPVSQMSLEGLIELYCQLGAQQDLAERRGEIAKFNRLVDRVTEIENELGRRPGDQRTVLLKLYGHAVMQVRLNAAKGTMKVAPAEARKQLELIAESKWYPQAADAGMYLYVIDGKFDKPRR